LGVQGLSGTGADLSIIQKVIERELIARSDTKSWQNLGIVFGDMLAKELDLHWVSYEDELGESKALRWRRSMNFVFPVTLFSKRIQFNQPLDALQIFEKIQQQVQAFEQTSEAYEPGAHYDNRSVLEFEENRR